MTEDIKSINTIHKITPAEVDDDKSVQFFFIKDVVAL